ncbi:carbohydrate kinase family protein [Mangrovihabitans endophyticus]|uniref:carbohydrate kinase family protein n=1 Tax=Mangrovihabitans endophyticus TaxID=1751298 RepID=UPI00166DF070|nr:PfkB family carbohydrate kinase [Mangrovihabitans endophyticus]
MIVVGDLVTDVVVAHREEIQPGTDTPAMIRPHGGGQGANTAAWLAHAGAAVTLIAAVGDDTAGRERVAELDAAGVRCAVRAHAGAVTGTVVVLSSSRERTLITDPGACLLLDPDHVRTAVRDVPHATHLHLSGYALLNEGSRAAGREALRAALRHGLTVSVDASSAGPLRAVGAEAFLDWVRGADLLLCNADEAAVLSGHDEPEAQAAALIAAAGHVVIKLGGDGARWTGPDGSATVRGTRQPMVDPTGAGDAFAAGLLHSWMSGATPVEALAAGAALGATAVGRVGARPSITEPLST